MVAADSCIIISSMQDFKQAAQAGKSKAGGLVSYNSVCAVNNGCGNHGD